MNNGLMVREARAFLFGNLFPHSISLRFSSRRDGNMSFSGPDPELALANRRVFLQAAGIDPSHLVCARQVHSDTVVCVQRVDAGRGAQSQENAIADTDALITNQRRLPLAVFTADCLAVFLYDSQKQVIAVVHAGWRGTEANITGKTVQTMMKEYDCQPEDIYAGFGPAIRGCCYQVKEEFADRFKVGIIRRDDGCYLDLARVNREQLLRRDIEDANIFDASLCTACLSEEYYSFRKAGDACGRGMSVLMLR